MAEILGCVLWIAFTIGFFWVILLILDTEEYKN